MKYLQIFTLASSVALIATSGVVQAKVPSIAYNSQNITLNNAQCLNQAKSAMKKAGFSVLTRKSLVVGSHKDEYKATIVCEIAKKMAFFVVSGTDFSKAQKLNNALKKNFSTAKSSSNSAKEEGNVLTTSSRRSQASKTPSISYNWQASSSQCLNNAKASMKAGGFSVTTGKSFVVGANKEGYKGLILCISSKRMALFSVSGADFAKAGKLTATLKKNFNTTKKGSTSTSNSSAITAPSLSYNWQNIKPSMTQCLNSAKASMKKTGFSVKTTKSLVVGASKTDYKGVTLCIPSKRIAIFLASGADFSKAQKLAATLKKNF
ncbi:hypothetical protein [Candidatus Parabeggiatoa sp. HSG14]|uniref:hypothetical protein n=1 Tax=Candidatus Parabeggiatoa sp. HSG14 TaxID=3055593 RepID=UPI0025A8284F|nr:hypothetical protein [Thiotrichales bacterium HSG14]